MTDDKSNQLRAVFFAALMVLWVFAGTVAFAGGAAAVSDGDLENTSVDSIGDNSAGATTTYSLSTEFQNTNDPSSDNPSGVAAVELDFSDAGTFGGNVDNFSSRDQVNVTIVDTNAGEYNESTTRVVQLQDNFSSGDRIALDFQEKENVSDDATLYVNFTEAVINNPDVGDTYEVEFRSYTDSGLSGNFKAQNASYTITGTADGGDDGERQTDRKFSGGRVVWKGQILDFQANPSACNTDPDSYQLRYYDSDQDDNQGTLIREISLNSSDGAQIPTKNVAADNRVVVTAVDQGDGERKVVDVGNEDTGFNGEQTTQDGVGGSGNDQCYSTTSSDSDNDWVEVVEQSLNASFQNDRIRQDQVATLDVTSNRNGYDLYVASEDFSQSELNRIIEGSTTNNINTDRTPSDGSVRVNGINSSAEINFDFAGEDTGNYSFTLSPTDTTPTDTAEIEVVEAEEGVGEFDSDTGAFTVKRGDIQSPEGSSDATISIRNANDVDTLVLFIGEADDDNYRTRVVAQPDDDGRIDIRMNTFLAGNVDDGNESKAYEATNGTVISVRRQTEKITGVLDEGQYDVTLEDTDGLTLDQGVLNINTSSYESLEQSRHPNTQLNTLDEKSELADNEDLTETKLVTLAERSRSDQRDILVHRVNISGIYGVLDALAENDLDNADGNQVLADAQSDDLDVGPANDAILDVALTQINFKKNSEPKVETYADPSGTDAFRFVIDEDNETVYLVSDPRDLELERETGTGTEDVQIEPGNDFDLTFDVGPGYNSTFEGGIDTYKPEGSVTTQLDVEDREAEFQKAGNDQVYVEDEANQTISAETNVAPGTPVVIQVDSSTGTRRANDTNVSEENPIFARKDAEVTENGTFSADFDFSDNQEGRRFSVSSPGTGYADDAQKPGVILGPASAEISDVTVSAGQDELAQITVDSVYLPDGGFVTIHDGSLQDGDTFDSVRGTSGYLDADTTHTNVVVTLDSPYTEDGTAIAMPHKDTNYNEEYDFVDSEGAEDGPYTDGGDIVVASASVTFEQTETPTDTPEPGTDELTETETPEPTDTPTPTPDQPGFGAALALIALIGAALLAARRRDF
jgi:surface glycoprotein (TIGR04207 family)/PGF-CTERM protein